MERAPAQPAQPAQSAHFLIYHFSILSPGGVARPSELA